MKTLIPLIFIIIAQMVSGQNLRYPIDTVGFVQYNFQIDSVIQRLDRIYKDKTDSIYFASGISEETRLKTVICPHDDYSYAQYQYPLVLSQIKAKTVIVFGVCHKARKFDLSDKIIFDSFNAWKEPLGNVKISDKREQLMKALPKDDYIVHNKMQILEHSVEAEVPFLQYFNHDVEIIPILVPYMDIETIKRISGDLSKAINEVFDGNVWGEDYAILISSDAVHYGNEDWGGSNFAFLGDGNEGYKKAVEKEHNIINTCFTGLITPDKINQFVKITVDSADVKNYKWTWCGRFSIPFGLYTSLYLQQLQDIELKSCITDYSTSLENPPLKVDDLRMGVTAPAKINHWVGYAAVGYQ